MEEREERNEAKESYSDDDKDSDGEERRESSNEIESEQKKVLNVKKEHRGIIYMSYIPPGLNVQRIRQIFSEFGDVTNVYLEPEKRGSRKQSRVRNYTEGWVEFKKKRIAKKVAAMLNGRQVGGKRRYPYYDSIWSIKYLHRFKWSNLRDQLVYEKALRDQRLRFEVGQAKKEANFYINMHEEYKRRKRKREQVDEECLTERNRYYKSKQRQTDQQIREEKNEQIEGVDVELLKKIFN